MSAHAPPAAVFAIGEVARRVGTVPSTVRFYERVGLLPEAARVSGRRRYSEDDVRRLEVIAVAKGAGFSLAEIQQLLAGFPRDATPAERWQTLAKDKLEELDALARRIDDMRTLLTRGLDCGCRSLDDCELFAEARDTLATSR